MIKITKAIYIENYRVELVFSTKERGVIDLKYLLEKETVLTNSLKDKDFFKDFFLELGAICWKNGLELSGESLYEKVKKDGNLATINEAA